MEREGALKDGRGTCIKSKGFLHTFLILFTVVDLEMQLHKVTGDIVIIKTTKITNSWIVANRRVGPRFSPL